MVIYNTKIGKIVFLTITTRFYDIKNKLKKTTLIALQVLTQLVRFR